MNADAGTDRDRASWSRTDWVLALANVSLRVSGPLFEAERLKNAGQLEESSRLYRQLCDLLADQLALTLEFNATQTPPPMAVVPIVGTFVNTLSMSADLEDTLGRRDEAERIRGEAQRLAAQYLPEADVAQRKRDLASVRLGQSRYREALTLLAEARDELEHRGDAIGSANVGAQLAEALEWLGDTRRARDEAARASALLAPMVSTQAPSMTDLLGALLRGDLQGAERQSTVLKIWSQLAQLDGRLSRELGDYARATALFEQVRGSVPSYAAAGIDFQLARIQIEQGNPREGLRILDAIAPAFVGLLRPKLGVLMVWRARALLALDRAADALAAASPAIDELRSHSDFDALWRAHWLLARIHLALDRPDTALAHATSALATIADLRHGTLGHRLDSTFLADKLPVVEAALDLAVRGGHAEQACRILESVKARALIAILGLPRGGDADDARHDDIDSLSRQLDRIEYQAFANGWSDELQALRTTLLENRAALIERARIADPRWRSLSVPEAFDLTALVARLRASHAAAVTLYFRPTEIVAVVVDGEGCVAGARTLGPATVEALASYRGSLTAQHPPIDPGDLSGLGLDELLPPNVLARMLRASSLAIAPHGFLHLVPWGMLRYRGERLFQHCPSSVVPNLTWLTRVPAPRPGGPRVFLLGDPAYARRGLRRLAMAHDELREIADTYGASRVIGGRPVEGAAATSAALRDAAALDAADGATLHVVCHGDFVADEPLYSGLLLADDKLDAGEISRVPLRFHEVVLSACSTGYRPSEVGGVPLTGDDVVGLVGAFLEAGARTVVVSITRAEDQASHAFMTTYHHHRAAGTSPARALQQTQEAMLDAATYAPGLWAGFVVYGAP